MKQFLIITSIIILVSLPFLFPSIENAQDGSFNDYEYLQKLRRTHTDVNNDDKTKGWQDNGIFNSWYQPGNGSENDKALNNLKPPSTSPSNVPVSSNISSNVPSNTSSNVQTNESKTNIIPYLLLVLLLMIVILVIYIKYKYV